MWTAKNEELRGRMFIVRAALSRALPDLSASFSTAHRCLANREIPHQRATLAPLLLRQLAQHRAMAVRLILAMFAPHGVDEAGKPAPERPSVARAKRLEVVAALPPLGLGRP